MKISIFTISIITLSALYFLSSCGKDFNHSGNTNGIDTTRLLKEYRIYFQPGVKPDSILGFVSYDTIKRTIILKQYFDGLNSAANSWKYIYNTAGYLTGVYDITSGEPGHNVISVFYDQNMEVQMITAPGIGVDNISYTTNYLPDGKEVVFYDTAYSGYLGGSKFGVGKIFYNNQNQLTERYLFAAGSSGTFDTSQLKLSEHEFFSYDAEGNLLIYQQGGNSIYSFSGAAPDLPPGVIQQIFKQHDNRGNELYEFEHILLKGVINKLSGNALIDPLGDVVGGGGSMATYYFQNVKYPTLEAFMPFQLDYNTGKWQYQAVSNIPVYDTLERLVKTTLLTRDNGVGNADIYLDY